MHWLPIVLLMLPACKRQQDDNPDGSGVTFLSEGSGPTNELSLWPQNAGNLIGTRRAGVPATIGGEIRQVWHETTLDDLGLSWTSTWGEGVFLDRWTPTGWLASAPLHVPTEVRVGMQWRTNTDHGELTYTVTERLEETTAWGDTTLWRIVSSSEQSDKEWLYQEGIGLVGNEFVTSGNGIVTQLDADPAPEGPALSMLALDLPGDIESEVRVLAVGSVAANTSATTILVTAVQEYANISGEGENPVNWCLVWDGDRFVGLNTPTAGDHSTFAGCHVDHIPVPNQYPDAWLVDTQRQLVYPGGTLPVAGSGDNEAWGAWFLDEYDQPTAFDGREMLPQRPGVAIRPSRPTAMGMAERVAAIHTPGRPAVQALVPQRVVDGKLPIAEVLPDGRVLHSLWQPTEDAWLRGPRDVVALITGRVSTLAYEGGRSVLLASPDGGVDRIHLRDEGIELERLAHLELSEGDILAGVTPLPDGRAIAVTHRLLADPNPFEHGEARFHLVDLPASGELWTPPVPPPQVGQGTAGAPWATVCSPRGASPATDAGDWMVSGLPPAVSYPIPGLPCSAVFGAPELVVDLNGMQTWRFEGSIEGYGMVRTAEQSQSFNATPLWSLDAGDSTIVVRADGAYLSAQGVRSPDGMAIGPALGLPSPGLAAADHWDASAPDVDGQRIWFERPKTQDNQTVADLVWSDGHQTRSFTLDGTESLLPVGTIQGVAGGGVIIEGVGVSESPTGRVLIDEDGARTPAASLGTVFLPDGRGCSTQNAAVVCRDAAGAEESFDLSGEDTTHAVLWGWIDATHLVVSTGPSSGTPATRGPSVSLDITTGQTTPLWDAPLWQVKRSWDGRTYALAHTEVRNTATAAGEIVGLWLDTDGATSFDIPQAPASIENGYVVPSELIVGPHVWAVTYTNVVPGMLGSTPGEPRGTLVPAAD